MNFRFPLYKGLLENIECCMEPQAHPFPSHHQEAVSMKIIQLALVLESPEQAQNTIEWAQSHRFLVKGHNPYYVDVAATPDAIASAFGVDLTLRQDGAWYPQSKPVRPEGVHAIVGIDARPTGHRSNLLTTGDQESGFFPKDIRGAYHIPNEYTGEGETIGILQFNSGYSLDSLDGFTMETGLTTLNRPTLVTVDGGHNDDGTSRKIRRPPLISNGLTRWPRKRTSQFMKPLMARIIRPFPCICYMPFIRPSPIRKIALPCYP